MVFAPALILFRPKNAIQIIKVQAHQDMSTATSAREAWWYKVMHKLTSSQTGQLKRSDDFF